MAMLVEVIERWIRRGVVSADVPVARSADIVPAAAFRSVVLQQRGLPRQSVLDLVDHVVLPALTVGAKQ
ncbi:hypothetical protein [Microbacterium sp. CIAB417]|uniref:hypothetical protein n=1 Tax=Microbacterium sp. CIAB417 TaxID=2860287 RepID=UPI001FAD4E01|nr:hypothetical protein [Microbacterium sp. CIAB417]